MQHLGLKMSDQVFQNFFGLEHATVAHLATGLVPLPHLQHMRAIRAQLRDIALGGRVGPHLAVHGRRQQEGHLVKGARQAHQAEEIVGAAMQQLGHEVGTRRGHQNCVRFPPQVDVGHVVGLSGIPLGDVDRPVGEGLHRHRRHELGRCFGHDHLHRGASFD